MLPRASQSTVRPAWSKSSLSLSNSLSPMQSLISPSTRGLPGSHRAFPVSPCEGDAAGDNALTWKDAHALIDRHDKGNLLYNVPRYDARYAAAR